MTLPTPEEAARECVERAADNDGWPIKLDAVREAVVALLSARDTAIRNAALEEAANMCERHAEMRSMRIGWYEGNSITGEGLAHRIRALKKE